MGSPSLTLLRSESPLLTYRLTWHLDRECIDHLVLAHDSAEARLISADLMRRALGRRADCRQLKLVSQR